MAFIREDDGSFKIDDNGNYMVDDGATIVNYLPDLWESNDDPTVEVTEEVETVINLTAVGDLPITWDLSGPDEADFELVDNGDGTGTLTVPGLGNYEIVLTATNAIGSDFRTLIVEVTDEGVVEVFNVQGFHPIEYGCVGMSGLHLIELGAV